MPRTILLADDSPTIRKIIELTFSDTEIRVESVATGQEALDAFEELQPDLVLADVVMPEPSGYEVCRAIKRSDSPVPVLLLAGTFEPFDDEQARDCEADGHLVKPFESDVLIDRVRALLAKPAPPPEQPPVHDETETPEEATASDPAESTDTGDAEVVVEELDSLANPSVTGEATQELVDLVAREVVRRLSDDVVREIAREIVPDLASRIIRERIREIEDEQD